MAEPSKKARIVAALQEVKRSERKTYNQIAEETGLTNVYVAQLLKRQAQLKPQAAPKLKAALPGLPEQLLQEMMLPPLRSYDPNLIQEPTVYRLNEAVMHYGESIKEIINEEFGDGIMSAIDFYCSVDKVKGVDGKYRVVVTFDGEYLPYSEQEIFSVALPQEILHNILSRLSPRDGAAAGSSSRDWNDAWITRPNLLFTNAAFSTENLGQNQKSRLRYEKQKIGIDSLEIFIDGEELQIDDVISQWNKWILTALENGATIIKYLPDAAPQSCLDIPPVLFQAESLVDLMIKACKLELQGIENIKCHNLKCLSLLRTSFDGVVLEKIISSCPLISKLEILDSFGFDSLKVLKLEKLKHLDLLLPINCSVEVQSSSLEWFRWNLEDEDEWGSTLTLHACPNLKILSLDGIVFTEEFFSNFECKFPQLEDLKICACLLLPRTRISSKSVKKLTMSWNTDLEEVEIDVPSLEIFEFNARDIPQFIVTAVSTHCSYKKNGKIVHSL